MSETTLGLQNGPDLPVRVNSFVPVREIESVGIYPTPQRVPVVDGRIVGSELFQLDTLVAQKNK